MPTARSLLDFLSHQLLVNCVAWTTGLTASGLVTYFFEVKGFRNLWGLTASGGRTLLSAGDYQLVMTVTSFCVGLAMMILSRHFVRRWLDEVRSLRRTRDGRARPATDSSGSGLRACVPDLDDLDFDPHR